ncbi:MAG: hypothetical protein ABIH86_05350 [Planctomycetota bacterium]
MRHRLTSVAFAALIVAALVGCGNPDYPEIAPGSMTLLVDPLSRPLVEALVADFVNGVSDGDTMQIDRKANETLINGLKDDQTVEFIVRSVRLVKPFDGIGSSRTIAACFTDDVAGRNKPSGCLTKPFGTAPLTVSIVDTRRSSADSDAQPKLINWTLESLRKIAKGEAVELREFRNGSPKIFLAGETKSALHLWVRDSLTDPQTPLNLADFYPDVDQRNDLAKMEPGAVVLSVGEIKTPRFASVSIDGKRPTASGYQPSKAVVFCVTPMAFNTDALVSAFYGFCGTDTARQTAEAAGFALTVRPKPKE